VFDANIPDAAGHHIDLVGPIDQQLCP